MKHHAAAILAILIVISSFPISSNAEDSWICLNCGRENTTNFCVDCGAKKPTWICKCGSENTTLYCGDCGSSHEKLYQEYKQADAHFNRKEYEKAIDIFTDLGYYSDSRIRVAASYYSLGEQQREKREWDNAILSFKAAGFFPDAIMAPMSRPPAKKYW